MIVIFNAILSLCVETFAAPAISFYVVKPGDSLSMILYRSGLKPIYTKNGLLRHLHKSNPQLRDTNIILPGEKIIFSDELVTKGRSLGLIDTTAEGQVYFVELKPSEKNEYAEKSEAAPEPAPPDAEEKIEDAPIAADDLHGFVSLGVGMAYFGFSQSGSTTQNLEYSSFSGPSLSIQGGLEWHNGFGFVASYETLPGEIRSSVTTISNSRFNWTAISIEATKRFEMFENQNSKFHFRLGLQRHDLPYVQLQNGSIADVRKSTADMLTVGADYEVRAFDRWRVEAIVKYEALIAQSSLPDEARFQNGAGVSGTLGLRYDIAPSFNVGACVSSQLPQSRYSVQSQTTSDQEGGQNKVLSTNTELRFGYEF